MSPDRLTADATDDALTLTPKNPEEPPRVIEFVISKGGVPTYEFDPSLIYFRVGRVSLRYASVPRALLLKNIAKFKNCYEVVPRAFSRRVFVDIDAKHGLPPLSYEQIVAFAENTTQFFEIAYGHAPRPTYRVQVSIEPEEPIPELFKSAHIIFDVATETTEQAKQLMSDFVNQKPKLHEYIDLSVYSHNQIFRAPHQAKEGTGRTDKLYPIERVAVSRATAQGLVKNHRIKKVATTTKDFITFVEPDTPYIDVVVRENMQRKILRESTHAAEYRIDESLKAYKAIQKLTEADLIDPKKWKHALICVESVLLLKGLTPPQIMQDKLMNKFLTRSRVGRYASDEVEAENRRKIEAYLTATPKDGVITHTAGFFRVLQNAEVQFIYETLKTAPDTPLLFDVKKHGKHYYIHIGRTALYDIANHAVLIGYRIETTKRPNKADIITITAGQQYNFFVEQIKRRPPVAPTTKYEYRDITSYDEVPRIANGSTFVCGPVGSRKSSLCMRADIVDILRTDTTSRLLFVCDTKTMIMKTTADITRLMDEEGYDGAAAVFNYEDKGAITAAHRALITTYDSLHKFKGLYAATHGLFDEFKNITTRFIAAGKKTTDNEERSENIIAIYAQMNALKAVKIYDADADEYLLRSLQRHTNKRFIVYNLTGYEQYNHSVVITNEAAAVAEIIALLKAGKKVSVSSAWRTRSLELNAQMSGLNKRICVITSSGAFDSLTQKDTAALKEELIANPALWSQYDLMIYSPTITTGVSFDPEGVFYKHYAFLANKGPSATQQAQSIYRVRKLESREIVLCSIEDRLRTLTSAAKAKNTARQDAYNTDRLIEGRAENMEERVAFITEVPVEDELRYDQADLAAAYDAGAEAERSKTALFTEWRDIANGIEAATNETVIYDVVARCKKWGSHNINFRYYNHTDDSGPAFDPVDAQPTDAQLNECTEIDYLNEKWINAEYVEITDYSEQVKNDDGDAFWNREKTLTLQKFGFSEPMYSRAKPAIDNWYKMNGAKPSAYADYRAQGNIGYYFEYKDVIYDIFNHALRDRDQTYIDLLFKSKTLNGPVEFINKIFGITVAFKVFDYLGTTHEDIVMIYEGMTTGYAVEKAKYLQGIQDIIGDVRIANVFNAITAFKGNRISGFADPYKNAGLILTYAFKQIGLSFNLNKKDERRPKDRLMNIQKTTAGAGRIQQTRDYTDAQTANEYDDALHYPEAILKMQYGLLALTYPKIRLPGQKHYDTLDDWIKTFVAPDQAYRLRGELMDAESRARATATKQRDDDEEDDSDEEDDPDQDPDQGPDQAPEDPEYEFVEL